MATRISLPFFFCSRPDVVLVLPAIPAYFREKHIVSRYIVIQYVISFFDMPQGSSPMWFGAVSGGVAGGLQGCTWITPGATQLAFALLRVLSATGRNSSSENLILCGAAGLVGWDSQKNQLHGMNTPTNPGPPSLQPQPIPDKTPSTTTLHKY